MTDDPRLAHLGPRPPPSAGWVALCAWCDAPVRVDSRFRCRNCGAPAPANARVVFEPGLVVTISPGQVLQPDPLLAKPLSVVSR